MQQILFQDVPTVGATIMSDGHQLGTFVGITDDSGGFRAIILLSLSAPRLTWEEILTTSNVCRHGSPQQETTQNDQNKRSNLSWQQPDYHQWESTD